MMNILNARTLNPIESLVNTLLPKHWRELYRLYRNHKWDINDEGDLLISHARISGRYETYAPDGLGCLQTSNLLTLSLIHISEPTRPY
mgnify:CR=1 FL=1